MISNRISDNSCDKNYFDKAAPNYNIALKNSGFKDNVTYIPNASKRQTRKKQIIWFNTPYSANVKTNVGKIFMRIVDKHFSKIQHHQPSKLAIAIEKQTVLWMVTVFLNALFTKHLLIQLLINMIIVLLKILPKNATITINVLLEINLVTGTLKCPRVHGNWKRERDISYFINWDIALKLQKYVCGSRKCDSCICEKLFISRVDPSVLLNKRDELVSKCWHRNKFILKCFKGCVRYIFASFFCMSKREHL